MSSTDNSLKSSRTSSGRSSPDSGIQSFDGDAKIDEICDKMNQTYENFEVKEEMAKTEDDTCTIEEFVDENASVIDNGNEETAKKLTKGYRRRQRRNRAKQRVSGTEWYSSNIL
ncbi:unnamed protein product [Bursaphelenchus okinawaensis]|uniref:Uncharacterized protein n=1 Tax=Bursaphelenchus okinawaensis TaxID=465554 RepID=A0A811JQJ0_9BILA|nr:unnamed protein product [Bursaphelenchus okinawaensis]CAG9077634.1 unnamed protein product [Bursaphelenchus okinawaensis]